VTRQVIDLDPRQTVQQFNDLSKVEKYVISEDAYDKRKGRFEYIRNRPPLESIVDVRGCDNGADTFRKFKEKNLARSAEEQKLYEEKKQKEEEEEKKVASKIKIGDRCQIGGKTANPKRGEVKYIGR